MCPAKRCENELTKPLLRVVPRFFVWAFRRSTLSACLSAGEETSGEGGGTGVEDEGGDQEGEREESEEEEERGQGEGREEEYDHHDGILEVNPELSWEMAQSVAYRLAKKRSIIDLALLARAEMRRTGLSEGMVVSISEWHVRAVYPSVSYL